MLKRTIVSFLTVAAMSSAAFGAGIGDTGFYGGLGLGRSDSDANAGSIAGAKDNKDNAWKAFAGYQFSRNFAVEGGYADLGRASVIGPAGAASFDSQAWQASVVGSLPLSQQFALTGKLGVARTSTDVVGNIGTTPVVATDRNTEPTYGLGARYDFTREFGVRGEWERFRAGGDVFGKSDVDLFTLNGIYRFY
jgi:OmpA-OmpF porin, OOP family